MQKQTGIWLDLKNAYIITLEKNSVDVKTIDSNIEDYHVKGGARSKQPWGPMDKTSESKYLERRKQQAKKYYARIKEEIQEVDMLYIFGPAEAKVGLEKAMMEDHNFKPIILAVETADSMTQNQMVAEVRSFFEGVRK